MGHFILAPFGSAGDVLPYLWLARHLRQRGHRVTAVTANVFEKTFTDEGFAFLPCATDLDFKAVVQNPDLWDARKGMEIVFRYAGQLTTPYVEAIRHAADQDDPSQTVLVAAGFAFGARLAREILKRPLITVHLQPSCFLSLYETPVFDLRMAWLNRLPRWMKRIFFSLPNSIDRFDGPAIREACAAANVPAPKKLFVEWWHSPDGIVALFPDWFARPQPDWPAPLYMHTFPLEDLAGSRPLPTGLEKFLDDGEKPIVFTPGSAMHYGHQFFEAAVGACLRLKRRAVFITRDANQLPSQLPHSILHVEYAAFSRVFPRAAAVVHHAGIGTLSQGLAAGVPQLVMPMAHDQPDNAHRLLRLGVGRFLAPRDFTASNVAEALRSLLEDDGVRAACKRCAGWMRNDPKPDALCAWLEQKLG